MTKAKEATRQEIEVRRRLANGNRYPEAVRAFLDKVIEMETESLESDAEEELAPYDDNRRTAVARMQDERLPKISEWLAKKPNQGDLSAMDPEHAKFVRAASHFWLDKKEGFSEDQRAEKIRR